MPADARAGPIPFPISADIGNARIAGMEEDLQTRPPWDGWYGWALSAFYIAYIVFEWMSVLWRLIPAHIYVAVIVASWGVIASLQAVCTSYAALVALRALLGVAEAAFTGVPFYLSFFFKRHELAFRTAIFISGMSLSARSLSVSLSLSCVVPIPQLHPPASFYSTITTPIPYFA